ncbi:MAG TPA: beta-ketoacyl-[acyl-carrier-protein] synthase II [candidate division Zixibacteria bacterium]|nr:beta-ketoacyl-[acyl-carrier-protein] synthase II [candidate division Zixibacteria bacterium]
MKRRVVITGVGAVTPLGNDPETFWNNLLEGKSGVGRVTRFDVSGYQSQIAGEVKDFDISAYVDPKEARRWDLYAQYAFAAASQACRQAKIEPDTFPPDRAGVIIASGIGGITTLLSQYEVLLKRGNRRVSPFVIPMMIPDIASALVSMKYNMRGPNFAIVSACASGAHAIGESFHMIRSGRADVIITGGSEAPVHPLAFAGFGNARALSTRNDDPEHASRPFDRDRDGFVVAEGAGIVVLEELESAKRRGAPILAEVVGYSATGDAYHITAPHPDALGAIAAMKNALADAGLSPEQVDYINTHGTSTPAGDVAEARAIKALFGTGENSPIINSTKSMTGHMLGAAGGAELVATVMTLVTGWVHPSINIENLDPEAEGLNIAREKIKTDPKVAISNSFGFGGHNATIVVKKYEE